MASMIQASEASSALLSDHFPEFVLEKRGLCEVKVCSNGGTVAINFSI